MKILVYSHAFAPKVGGVETYLMALATGLAREGAQNVAVSVVTPTHVGTFDDGSLPFRVLRQPGLKELIAEVRAADVVHVAGPCLLPMLIALVLRKPFAVEHHGYQTVCPNGMLLAEPSKSLCPGHFIARRYDKCLPCNAASVGWVRSLSNLLLVWPRRWACASAARNLPISEHVNLRLKLPHSKVIYYGIADGQSASAPAIACSTSMPADGCTSFAYIGRLVSEKGAGLLIQAASQLHRSGRDFRVKIIGDGPERPRLEEAVKANGLADRVAFTGYLVGDSLRCAVADVAAVVMPSICEETAGLAAIEQMMRGRLVIASDIGGLGEVVGDAGLKFLPGDAKGLEGCMRRVLDQPELIQRLGKKARERASGLFRAERMISDHVALYQELVEDRSCSNGTNADRHSSAAGVLGTLFLGWVLLVNWLYYAQFKPVLLARLGWLVHVWHYFRHSHI